MDSPQDVTIASYEGAVERYLESSLPTPSPELGAFRERVRDLVPGGRVLELGSGPGHDADWFEAAGLHVTRSDATAAFADRLRARGHEVLLLDVTRDALGGPYDLVWANAVLLHLSPEQLATALAAIAAAAPRLACTVKEGDGAGWSDAKLGRPRWFTYWREPDLRAALDAAGWRVEWLAHVAGRTEPWLYVLAGRA